MEYGGVRLVDQAISLFQNLDGPGHILGEIYVREGNGPPNLAPHTGAGVGKMRQGVSVP